MSDLFKSGEQCKGCGIEIERGPDWQLGRVHPCDVCKLRLQCLSLTEPPCYVFCNNCFYHYINLRFE